MKDIGKNIKAIRQSKEMTQEALAEALYVTRQTVSNYENGRSRPDLDMLIKIAEVLKTDVNTIIYGPPISQSKKDAYKWAAISLGVLAITWTLYLVINAVFDGTYDGTYSGHMYAARLINKQTVLPAFMLVLGWALLHILSLFSGLEQIKSKRVKIVRIVLLVVGCVLAAIPIPYTIWLGVVFYRSVTTSSVSMAFPYIAVYQEMYLGIVYLINRVPFVYSILGGLFWLFGLPRIKRQAHDTQAETE